MKNNYVIACDLDGFIFNFEEAFCDRFGSNSRYLSNLHTRYPEVDPDIINEFVESPETYRDLAPIFGGITFVRVAQSLGFGIVFLTSRPYTTQRETEQALALYNLDATHLFFTKDKTNFIELFNQSGSYKIRMLIDDIPANLEKLPSGVVGICWEQPWNDGKYPRARYNDEKMALEYKNDTVSSWSRMFKEKK